MTPDALSQRVDEQLLDIRIRNRANVELGYIATAGAFERYAALIRDLEADRQREKAHASRMEDAAFHFLTCLTCKRAGEDVCGDGRQFAAYMRGEQP